MTEKCCGKDLKRHHKETAKDGLTVWTTYRCAKCRKLQTTVEKKTSQFSMEDLDAIYGIFGGP